MRRVESTPPSNGERRPGWSFGGFSFSADTICSCLSDRRFFICVFSQLFFSTTLKGRYFFFFIFIPLIRSQNLEKEFTSYHTGTEHKARN